MDVFGCQRMDIKMSLRDLILSKGPLPKTPEAMQEFLRGLTEAETDEFCAAMAESAIRQVRRGDPATICIMHEALKELEKCATIDRDGNLVYDLDQRGKVLEFKK